MTQLGTLQELPLSELRESPDNPRKYFSAAGMTQLVASIKASGLWTPLIVRKKDDGYEIGAGARRFRAAKEAGFETVPCEVREMDEDQFLRILSFENGPRENVNAMDEAAGIRFYRERTGASVPQVAAEMGVSVSQVHQRLKLLDAISEVQKACWEGIITTGHAVIMARQTPDKQLDILKHIVRERSFGGDVFSVRDLQNWLTEDELGESLQDVPFSLSDAELIPAAGSCDDCPQRSDDFCGDKSCFESKLTALVERQKAAGLVPISTSYADAPAGVIPRSQFTELPDESEAEPPAEDPAQNDEAAGEAEPPKPPAPICAFAEKAVVEHGANRGDVVQICRSLECPVHGATNRREQQEAVRQTESGKPDYWAERAKALPKKIEWATRLAILDAVLSEPIKWTVPHEQLQLIGLSLIGGGVTQELLDALGLPWQKKHKNMHEAAKALRKDIESPAKSPAAQELPRILLALSLRETAKEFCYKDSDDVKRLMRAAEVFKINAKKIGESTAKLITDEFKKKRDAARERKRLAEKKEREKAKAVQPVAAQEPEAPVATTPAPKPSKRKPGTFKRPPKAGCGAEVAPPATVDEAPAATFANPGPQNGALLASKSKRTRKSSGKEAITPDNQPSAGGAAVVAQPAPSYPEPNENGEYSESLCEVLKCPAIGIEARLLTVECADGWRCAGYAKLAEGGVSGLPRQKDNAYPSQVMAQGKAAGILLSFARVQEKREGAKKKHKEQASKLRAWLEMLLEEKAVDAA